MNVPLSRPGESFAPLDACVPPADIFEPALGYFGASRYITLFAESSGADLAIADRRGTLRGDLPAYLLWSSAAGVSEALNRYLAKDYDTGGRHAIVLDRKDRRVYAGSLEPAIIFSRFSGEYFEGGAARPADQSQLFDRLAEWLERCSRPNQGREW